MMERQINRVLGILPVIILLVILTGVTFAQPPTQPIDFRFADSTYSTKFPFDLYMNLIFIQAQVNESAPLWFILDSGAEGTILNSTAAETIGLKVPGGHSENAPGGEVEVSFADSLDFHFSGVDVLNQRVMIIRLDPLEPIVGRRIDGILGLDYFVRFAVDIDYGKNVIGFVDPRRYVYSGTGIETQVVVENNESFVFAYLESQDHGPIRAKLKIDTGSMDVLGLNGSFVQTEHLFGPLQKTIPTPGVGLGGFTKNYVTRLKSLRLGEIVVENAVIGFSEDTLRGGDAGTIAGELFRRFRMIFDYYRQRVIWERTERLSEPYEFDMSGLFPIAERPDFKTIRIQYIAEDSPAADAGIKTDDIIQTIDSKPAGDYTIAELRRMFLTEGKSYRLIVDRQGKLLELVLSTRKGI